MALQWAGMACSSSRCHFPGEDTVRCSPGNTGGGCCAGSGCAPRCRSDSPAHDTWTGAATGNGLWGGHATGPRHWRGWNSGVDGVAAEVATRHALATCQEPSVRYAKAVHLDSRSERTPPNSEAHPPSPRLYRLACFLDFLDPSTTSCLTMCRSSIPFAVVWSSSAGAASPSPSASSRPMSSSWPTQLVGECTIMTSPHSGTSLRKTKAITSSLTWPPSVFGVAMTAATKSSDVRSCTVVARSFTELVDLLVEVTGR